MIAANSEKIPDGWSAFMGTFSIWHWIIVLAIILLLFGGRGKLPALARDFAKSITSFKKGLTDSETAAADEQRAIDATAHSERAEPVGKDQDAKA